MPAADASLIAAVMEAIGRGVPRDYAWSGNVRELEQAVRRILLTSRYSTEIAEAATNDEDVLLERVRAGR